METLIENEVFEGLTNKEANKDDVEMAPVVDEERGEEKKNDNESDESDEEENSGVSFPGKQLDIMKDLKLDDIQISKASGILVELRDSHSEEFVFKYKKIKILCFGKCEFCYSYKPLTVECACKEV